MAVVFVAVVLGLCINYLGDKVKVLKTLLEEVNSIITVFLSFIITKFGTSSNICSYNKTFADIMDVEELKACTCI